MIPFFFQLSEITFFHVLQDDVFWGDYLYGVICSFLPLTHCFLLKKLSRMIQVIPLLFSTFWNHTFKMFQAFSLERSEWDMGFDVLFLWKLVVWIDFFILTIHSLFFTKRIMFLKLFKMISVWNAKKKRTCSKGTLVSSFSSRLFFFVHRKTQLTMYMKMEFFFALKTFQKCVVKFCFPPKFFWKYECKELKITSMLYSEITTTTNT